MPRHRMLFLTLCTVLIVAAGCTPIHVEDLQFTTYILSGADSDELIQSTDPDTPWDTHSFIWFAWDAAVFVQAPLPADIPAGTRISKALLTVPVVQATEPDLEKPLLGVALGPQLGLAPYRVLDAAWQAMLAEWLGQNTAPSPDVFLAPSSARPQYLWPERDNWEYVHMQFDVTDIVQAWLDGAPNLGIVIATLPKPHQDHSGGWLHVPVRREVFGIDYNARPPTPKPIYEELSASVAFQVWP